MSTDQPKKPYWIGLFCIAVFFAFTGIALSDSILSLPEQNALSNRIPKSTKALQPDFMEKIFGPTDINGAVGNGRLAAGISGTGTVTVLKWPRPSFNDQLRYLTLSRSLDRMGARQNDGIFLGLLFADSQHVIWLRDAQAISQKYLSEESNILVTTYQLFNPALKIEVFDVAPQNPDALIRHVRIESFEGDYNLPTSLIAFTNLALCRFKIPAAPVADWLFDLAGKDRIQYDAGADLLIQQQMGLEGKSGIWAGLGFVEPSDMHQCGKDGAFSTGGQEAFSDAADGVLSFVDEATGQVDGAISTRLDLEAGRIFDGTFFVVFAHDSDSVIESANTLRRQGAGQALIEAMESDKQWMEPACLPKTQDEQLLAVSRRALLLSRIVRDERSGALGCSVATQPPYSLDWIRDGAFVNLMLDIAGYSQIVTDHNIFYASIQREPLGNWDMCVYGDGTIGGPLFLELDTLAFGAWTLWDHYRFLNPDEAEDYLSLTYDPIKNAADFFVLWRDPVTKLPLPAWESDFPTITSTLLSACMAWLTLRCGIEAGNQLGEAPDKIEQWEARKEELTEAIFNFYFDPERQLFLADPYVLAYMIFPVGFLPLEDKRMQLIADELYAWLESIMNGRTAGGSYLGLISIALAKAWENNPEKLKRMEGILEFLAYELPTQGTLHYGECFVTLLDRFECRTGIPHPMTAALTYTTAAYTFGTQCPESVDDDDDSFTDNDPDESYSSSNMDDFRTVCGC